MIPGRIFMTALRSQQPAQAVWDGFCMLHQCASSVLCILEHNAEPRPGRRSNKIYTGKWLDDSEVLTFMRTPLNALGCIQFTVQDIPQGIEMWYLVLQAEALTLPVVVSRLINARRHWLALQISSLLGMGPEKVRCIYCFVADLRVHCWVILPASTPLSQLFIAKCLGAKEGHLRLVL